MTYARHVGLLRGCFCVFDVMNTTALCAEFVGRNTPAIFPHFPLLYFPLPHFQRPRSGATAL